MNGLPKNQETSTQTSLLGNKKVWLSGIGLLLLVAIIIAVRAGKLSPGPTVSQPPAPESTAAEVKNEFPDMVRREETLPESWRKNPQTKQLIVDGKIYIREQATVKQVLIPGQSYLLTTATKNEITSLINDQTLLADAWFGYDKFDNITNVQYATITKADLQRIKEGVIVQIMYLQDSTVNQNIILTEFVLME